MIVSGPQVVVHGHVLRLKSSPPIQPMDTERYAELVYRLTDYNAILGGGETIAELQQMLEEIEGEAAYQSFAADFYSF